MDDEHQDAAPADESSTRPVLSCSPRSCRPPSSRSTGCGCSAELDAEADELYALAERGMPAALDDLAAYRRRRAYVWVHLAQQCSEFEEKAAVELAAWQAAETAMTTAVAVAAGR